MRHRLDLMLRFPTNMKEMGPFVDIRRGDVLLGRSKLAFQHNTHFHLLIAKHSKAYLSGNRSDKTQLVQTLTRFIQSQGGRFLKRDKTYRKWYVVSFQEAKEKVSVIESLDWIDAPWWFMSSPSPLSFYGRLDMH